MTSEQYTFQTGRAARLLGCGCNTELEATMGERFGAASAGGYDRGFGDVSREFIPTLLRAARLAPGGHKCSTSPLAPGLRPRRLSRRSGRRATWLRPTYSPPCWRRFPAMLEKARERLGQLANVSFAIEDGQS